MSTLCVASRTDLADLAAWLDEHPDDLDLATRLTTRAWISDMIKETPAYPAFLAVHPLHEYALIAVIDDWSEMLGANDEPFFTYVNTEV